MASFWIKPTGVTVLSAIVLNPCDFRGRMMTPANATANHEYVSSPSGITWSPPV